MYGSQFLADEIQQESDLYDDLSLFIKTFKKIMILSHDLVEKLEDSFPSSALAELKSIPEGQLQLAEQYNSKLEQHSPNKNTINRFICRLYETLCLYKGSQYQRSKAAVLYRQFLERNEQIISSYQMDRNVGKMYKKILQTTEKFCKSCESIMNNGFQEEVASFFSKSQDKQQEQQIPLSPLISRKSSPYKSESNFHKAMAILNKRYNTLSCLDLDYNSYKSYYFQSRSQKQDIYKDFFQRNALTWKYINSYSKQFSEYLKKRQKNSLNRKNRFKEKLQTAIKSQAEFIGREKDDVNKNEEQEDVKGNCFMLKQIKQSQLPELYKPNPPTHKEEQSPERKLQLGLGLKQIQARKTQYNIKNIYLTLNKITQSNKSAVIPKEIKTLPKNNKKDKYMQYSTFKVSKASYKPTKFNQVERTKPRPLLEIRQIESRDYGYTLQNSMVNDNTLRLEEPKGYINPTKRLVAEKKSMRLNHLLSKNSFNHKIHKAQTLNDDDMACNIRIINGEEEELSLR